MSCHPISGALLAATVTLTLFAAQTTLEAANNTPLGAQWQSVPIIGGGFVSGIICHPTEPNLFYARTDVGGAYRWDQTKEVWIPITDWLPYAITSVQQIASLALDPNDADLLYIVGGDSMEEGSANTRLLRSSDRGDTFETITPPFLAFGNMAGRSNGERLVVDPNDSDILFYGEADEYDDSGNYACHLYKSTDKGSTWSIVSSFPVTSTDNHIGIVFVLPDATSGTAGSPTPVIYAGVSQNGQSLYKSTDGGSTWALVPNIPSTSTVSYSATWGKPTAILPHHAALDANGNLFITFCDNAGPNDITWGGLYKLDASTGGWTDVSPSHAYQGGYAGISINTNAGVMALSTLCRWTDNDHIYLSRDGGASWADAKANATYDFSAAPWMTWHLSGSTLSWHWIGDVEIDPNNPDRVMFVTGMGLWGTENAQNAFFGTPVDWSNSVTEGIEETVVGYSNQAMISPPEGANLLAVFADVDGFRFFDFDASPTEGNFNPIAGTCTSIDFAANVPSFITRTYYSAGNPGGAYSTDGGSTWTSFASEPSGIQTYGPGTLAVSADAANLVWAGRKTTAYYSNNNGSTWTACSGAPTSTGDWQYLPLTADRVNGNKFYLMDIPSGSVYASTDGGVSFVKRATTTVWCGRCLRATPGVEDDIWVALEWTSNGLRHSTDGGTTFTPITTVQECRCVGFGKAAEGSAYPTVFIYGEIDDQWGIYLSTDEGVSWAMIRKDGWGWVSEVDGDPRIFGRVYVSTGGRGILYGDTQVAPDWLANITSIGNNWFISDWYGKFYHDASFEGWIYSAVHGFQYGWGDGTPDNSYIWDPLCESWWWTSESAYPALYDFKTGSWFYYEYGEGADRKFWDYEAGTEVGNDAL